jgi:hypothetical protein
MIPSTMAIWFVVAIPVLIMFFALAMERLEHRLRSLADRESHTVKEHEVAELLHGTGQEQARALFGNGIGGALQTRRRRRPAVIHSRRVGERS